jgi:hypothetical protein
LFGVFLVLAIFETLLGLLLVALSWHDGRTMARLAAEGVRAEAAIEDVDVHFTRGWKIVKLKLAWTDTAGTTRRQTVTLSDELAPVVISGDRAIRPSLPIKYLPADPSADVLFLDDAERQSAVKSNAMFVGELVLGLGALALVGLYIARRHVRRKYPALPASFTSLSGIRTERRPTNSFFRVFMRFKYVTAPLLGGIIYGLRYLGVYDIVETLTGLSERAIWFMLVLAAVAVMGISGWCYDRYGEWRAEMQPQGSMPSANS